MDRTNLIGRYDIRLTWTPESQLATGTGGREVAPNTPNLPGLFTALREQLGPDLKAGRGPVEFLIIESAQKPTQLKAPAPRHFFTSGS